MQVDTFFPSFFPPVSYYFFLLNGVSRIKENAWCKGPAATKWLLSNPYILLPYLVSAIHGSWPKCGTRHGISN